MAAHTILPPGAMGEAPPRYAAAHRTGEGSPQKHPRRTKSPEYVSWCLMRQRCFNPNCETFAHYGGRGITVCDRWRYGEGGKSGFECFFEDMGVRPSPKHTLDRIDNDGPYAPWNCRWATKRQQCRNRRSNVIVRYDGRDMTLTEAAELSGFSMKMLWSRLQRGFLPEDLFRPKMRPGKNNRRRAVAV